MKKRIRFSQNLCIGCSACVIACADQRDIPLEQGAEPYRKVLCAERPNAERKLVNRSVACLHCAGAPCAAACPNGCIRTDERTGMVVYDNAGCTGCRKCLAACPVDAPKFPNGKLEKCDGCSERVAFGLPSACVKVCPTRALTLEDA